MTALVSANMDLLVKIVNVLFVKVNLLHAADMANATATATAFVIVDGPPALPPTEYAIALVC